MKKNLIAQIICSSNEEDYNENIKTINENLYRLIYKVPIDLLFTGIIDGFDNITISDIKEVVIEAIQLSGIEVTFKDSDWDELNFAYEPYQVYHTNTIKFYRTMNTTKTYMSEFFEELM